MENISENINKVRQNIKNAALRVNRNYNDILLVAVSKTKPEEDIASAIDSGILNFGENKVQELTRKIEFFKNEGCSNVKWHQIGRLQTNKVKYLIGKDVLIHSVDRLELAEEINKYSLKNNLKTDILVQVNVSKEETKAGIMVNEVDDFLLALVDFKGLNIQGLMTIGPKTEEKDEIRQVFSILNKIYLDKQQEKYNNKGIYMKYLSMGMSNDYEIAIEEGANLVRVGTGIFGKRDYSI